MNEHTLLLRQVHPHFFKEGQVSSQAFFPFPKDKGKLSVYDGDKIDGADAYQHYTVQLNLASVGVWAVNGAEVKEQCLTYQPDPLAGNEAHALIIFGERNVKECRKLAKRLQQLAIVRGCLYKGLSSST